MPLQVACYQGVAKQHFKRCLIRLQKGVSCIAKGHLLQASWALIESQKSVF